MPPSGSSHDWASVDVLVPRPSARMPGVQMAGFQERTPAYWDIRMVAHPSVTLLVDLNDGRGAISYHTPGGCDRGSAVIGLLPGDVRGTGRGLGQCLQIRLDPSLAAAALGTSGDLTGEVVPLDAIWGREAARVEDRLRAAASWDDRFAIATEILRRRLSARPRVDPEVVHTWRRTRATGGRLRVDGLADEVGWSRKRLWSRFRTQLGISPKRAARLVRFDHAARLLAAGHAPAGVAVASGYTDQPHLNRDFRELTGLTPADVATAPWLAIDDVAWPDSAPRGPRVR